MTSSDARTADTGITPPDKAYVTKRMS